MDDRELIKELFEEETVPPADEDTPEEEKPRSEEDILKDRLYDMGLRMDAAEFIAGIAKGADAQTLFEGAKSFASRPSLGMRIDRDEEDDSALRRAFGI